MQSAIDSIVLPLRRMHKRQFITQALNFGMIVASALMIWKSLMVYSGSESPIVVVLSGSMEPAFQRGDLLFLAQNEVAPFRVGEIIVFKIEGKDIPIVHRILEVHEKPNGDVDILTKGDNNSHHDHFGIYAQGQQWLSRKHVIGRVEGFLPYVGMMTILMNDYPQLKFALIFVLGLFVITNKEQ
eukprot:TRINITY_DN1200_c0_g1_i3.p1 TRINITY_DN1200_c0_g1~~TRINITY_DN1200_c0_g1_i3.p1  ORF type:complete len:195 (+),score=26.12 TRINITY_DN1200_c0_g1_i3:36-587(+)